MNGVDILDVCLCARFGHMCVHTILDVFRHFRVPKCPDVFGFGRFWTFLGSDVSGLVGCFGRTRDSVVCNARLGGCSVRIAHRLKHYG